MLWSRALGQIHTGAQAGSVRGVSKHEGHHPVPALDTPATQYLTYRLTPRHRSNAGAPPHTAKTAKEHAA